MWSKRILLILMVFTEGCTLKGSPLFFSDEKPRESAGTSEPVRVEARYGGRAYVESTLKEIFKVQEGTPEAEELQDSVYFNRDFGDGFDIYAASQKGEGAGYVHEFTRLGKGTGESARIQQAQGSPMRFAATMKVCEALLDQDVRLTAVMDRIHPGWTVAEAGRPEFQPSRQAVSAAYQVFYRTEDPDPDVIQAILDVGTNETRAATAWRNIWKTICYSTHWQMI
jgi:hypothetical protein